MGHERWFRGQHDGQKRPLDWLTAARQHGIPDKHARVLYEQAMQQAHGANHVRVQEIYSALLVDASRDSARPSPGKVTRTMRLQAARAGKRRPLSNISPITGQRIVPCKVSLTSYIEPAHRGRNETQVSGDLEPLARTASRAFTQPEETRADEAMRLYEASLGVVLGDLDALDARDRKLLVDKYGIDEDLPRPDEEIAAQLLPEATRAIMGRAFGQRFHDGIVHPDRPEVTGGMHAFTRGRENHFRPGTVAPGPWRGDHLIGRELPHVGQQSGGYQGLAAVAARQVAVQAKGLLAEDDPDNIRRIASEGIQGDGSRLPYLTQLQKSFGPEHDLSTIEAHVGGSAAEASERIGANAYAMGEHVAFRKSPDLHTVAHELVHVIQQRNGVRLSSGVGRTGDIYERQADAVADAVVAGNSASPLLRQTDISRVGVSPPNAVQRDPLDGGIPLPGGVPEESVSGQTGSEPDAAARAASRGSNRVTRIIFDGSTLRVFAGPQTTNVRAVSGLMARHPKAAGTDFTNPVFQGVPDKGPIPEAIYTIEPREAESSPPGRFDARAWGHYRVPLHENLDAQMRRHLAGRTGGFYLHQDANNNGTAGCIGIVNASDNRRIHDLIKGTTASIPVEVTYAGVDPLPLSLEGAGDALGREVEQRSRPVRERVNRQIERVDRHLDRLGERARRRLRRLPGIGRILQRKTASGTALNTHGIEMHDSQSIMRAAAEGITGSGDRLPYLGQIQKSFGPGHDLSTIKAHMDGAARDASERMGAEAYATGEHIAFYNQPDLHTAAHEAAHVVQQRGGVSLPGNVGQVGDAYERHADAVADAVVAGLSAEAMLETMSSGQASAASVDSSQNQRPASSAPGQTRSLNTGTRVQLTGDPVGPGYYAAGQTMRELGFALRHPVIAIAIGSVSPGSLNISTDAVRFSTNDLGLEETGSKEGSEVNAFRHALWQAEITEEYGRQIAREAGNAHEANPFAISGGNRRTTSFSSEAEADQSADLRNNEIGRSIGTSDDPVPMNQLALRVLDHFHEHGLWVVEQRTNGTWSVVQHRISDAIYADARERLLQFNEHGYDPEQWRERQEREAAR